MFSFYPLHPSFTLFSLSFNSPSLFFSLSLQSSFHLSLTHPSLSLHFADSPFTLPHSSFTLLSFFIHVPFTLPLLSLFTIPLLSLYSPFTRFSILLHFSITPSLPVTPWLLPGHLPVTPATTWSLFVHSQVIVQSLSSFHYFFAGINAVVMKFCLLFCEILCYLATYVVKKDSFYNHFLHIYHKLFAIYTKFLLIFGINPFRVRKKIFFIIHFSFWYRTAKLLITF